MKLGVSSYSFQKLIASGEMDLVGVIDWVADSPAEHLEIAALGDDLLEDDKLVETVVKAASDRGVPILNYLIGADLRGGDAKELDRVRRHIDVGHRLGARLFRHDVLPWGWREANQGEFEQVFPDLVAGAQVLADHAAELGITTTVENHGMSMNGSERVARLVHAVDRENFRVTLDLGNGLCVGEVPGRTVAGLLDVAAAAHVKDFHVRRSVPGGGWLKTLAGEYLVGTIPGHGDLDLRALLALVQTKPDLPVTLEFEGLEAAPGAVELGLKNVLALAEGA
ncbi:sugar phosphate isomerase/epimerase [Kribbella antibiotica]|uniref:Sugar phosphate isomerase/epimerase n=1 Tax=Kribbella antibiotica TaxID=190195 RepID=A0A4R4ZUN5_9ACTN|nr:TIM barrel protein [Kribbella antibiotica]TDD61894.1 sugar phosphate isomerase/epimerase [Kribbella antibiotica]